VLVSEQNREWLQGVTDSALLLDRGRVVEQSAV
jgi:hypothetical protein